MESWFKELSIDSQKIGGKIPWKNFELITENWIQNVWEFILRNRIQSIFLKNLCIVPAMIVPTGDRLV